MGPSFGWKTGVVERPPMGGFHLVSTWVDQRGPQERLMPWQTSSEWNLGRGSGVFWRPRHQSPAPLDKIWKEKPQTTTVGAYWAPHSTWPPRANRKEDTVKIILQAAYRSAETRANSVRQNLSHQRFEYHNITPTSHPSLYESYNVTLVV